MCPSDVTSTLLAPWQAQSGPSEVVVASLTLDEMHEKSSWGRRNRGGRQKFSPPAALCTGSHLGFPTPLCLGQSSFRLLSQKHMSTTIQARASNLVLLQAWWGSRPQATCCTMQLAGLGGGPPSPCRLCCACWAASSSAPVPRASTSSGSMCRSSMWG